AECEEPPLRPVEDVEVLDGFVHLAILQFAQSISVASFEEDASEGVQEVQVLRRGIEREWINRDAVLSQPQFDVAAVEQRGQPTIAATEIEDNGQRVVLLRMHKS